MICLSGSVTKIKAMNSIDWGVKSSTGKILQTCVCIVQMGVPGTMASILQLKSDSVGKGLLAKVLDSDIRNLNVNLSGKIDPIIIG